MAIPFLDGQCTYLDFFCDHLLTNEPCVFDHHLTDNWQSVRNWVSDDGQADLTFLEQNFGDAEVSVIESSTASSYGEREYEHMPLKDYIAYCRQRSQHDNKKLYLKDWHFQRTFPQYEAYSVPVHFQSDWINLESWPQSHPFSDDYKFVYFGVKGTWYPTFTKESLNLHQACRTPFHADVLGSYSWSANICGRKLWYFVRPGKEIVFKTGQGQLVSDIRLMKEKFDEAGVVELVQEPGQVIFVPSEWHHQVHNLEDTISINHNWINATNLDSVWNYIEKRWKEIRTEISDCIPVMGEEWYQNQCQLILRADARLDVDQFVQVLNTILKKRLESLKNYYPPPSCTCKSLFECKKNSKCRTALKQRLKTNCICSIENVCQSCGTFFNYYDFQACCDALKLVIEVCEKFCYQNTYADLLSSKLKEFDAIKEMQ